MRAKLKGKVKEMREVSRGDVSCVMITLHPEGSVTDMKGPDAKRIDADVILSVKQLVAQELKFGQELHFEVSTEPLADLERRYCYHCGHALDRMGPRDCPACG